MSRATPCFFHSNSFFLFFFFFFFEIEFSFQFKWKEKVVASLIALACSKTCHAVVSRREMCGSGQWVTKISSSLFQKRKEKKKKNLIFPDFFVHITCTKKQKTQKTEDQNKLELYGFWSSSGAMHKPELIRWCPSIICLLLYNSFFVSLSLCCLVGENFESLIKIHAHTSLYVHEFWIFIGRTL